MRAPLVAAAKAAMAVALSLHVQVASPPPSPPAEALGGAAIGVGAVGLVVGAVAGGLLLGQIRTIEGHCPNGTCDGAARRANDDAKATMVFANGGLGGGLAALTAGVALFLRAPQPAMRPSVEIKPFGRGIGGGGVVGIEGVF